MIKSFFWSKKWLLWAYGGGLIILSLLYGQVRMSLLLNEWYGKFYNLLQKATEHQMSEFNACLVLFVKIAVPYVALIAIMNFITRHYSFRWRTAMTFYYLPKWRNVSVKIEGESQRIQEDTNLFAKIVESLGLEAVRAIMNLIAFMPLLWELSKQVNVPLFLGGTPLPILSQTGKIIREIPPPELLALAKSMKKLEGLFVDNKV